MPIIDGGCGDIWIPIRNQAIFLRYCYNSAGGVPMLICILLAFFLPYQQEATAKSGYEQQILELINRKDTVSAE
jgi:hypothetical protein